MNRVLITIVVLCCLGGGAAPSDGEDLADPDVAIEAGREALAEQWDLNWYDEATDDFKPVNLPKPKKPRQTTGGSTAAGGGSFSLGLGDVMVFLMWLVAAGLLLWIIVALIRAYLETERVAANVTTQEVDARAHLDRVEALPVTLEEKVDNYLQAARHAYDAGDLSRAIVYLFSHELLELDRASRLRLVKGKTNRQYVRELRGADGPATRLSEILSRTVGVFEAAFFGGRTPDPTAFEACWHEATELEGLLSSVEGAAT